jgi:hypothetical protein
MRSPKDRSSPEVRKTLSDAQKKARLRLKEAKLQIATRELLPPTKGSKKPGPRA